MRAVSLVKLVCELQQTENVNPQQRHEMPVPGGDVNHDAAGLDGTMEQYGESGDEQGEDPAHQVNRVRACHQINERTAGVGAYKKAARGQVAPGHPLAGEE